MIYLRNLGVVMSLTGVMILSQLIATMRITKAGEGILRLVYSFTATSKFVITNYARCNCIIRLSISIYIRLYLRNKRGSVFKTVSSFINFAIK